MKIVVGEPFELLQDFFSQNRKNNKTVTEALKTTQTISAHLPPNVMKHDSRRYDSFYVCVVPGKDDIFGDSLQQIYIGCEVTHSANFSKLRQTATRNSIVGKSLFSVRALSYCDLHKIGIDDLCAILDVYPEFAGDFLQNFAVTFNLRKVSSPAGSAHARTHTYMLARMHGSVHTRVYR